MQPTAIKKPKVTATETPVEPVMDSTNLKVSAYKKKIVAVPDTPETKVMYVLGKRILGSVERLENKIYELSYPAVIEFLKKVHIYIEGTEESFNQLLKDAETKVASQKEEE